VNVLVLSHMFPSERDAGAGIFVLEQIRSLRAAGHKVTVVSPTPWAPRSLNFLGSVKKYMMVPRSSVVDEFPVARPRVPTLPHRWGFWLSGLLFYLSCRRVMRRILKHNEFDVIHAHAIMPDGFAAVLLGMEFHLPTVCTVHGSDVNVYPATSRLVRLATIWALRHVDRVITVSAELRKHVLALAGKVDVAVIHNGADTSKFKPTDKKNSRATLALLSPRKIVCFVGYLRPEKGIEFLLEAFAGLQTPNSQLCIVGDGPLRQSLMAQADKLGIARSCLFAGKRPHDEVPLWLSASDCLVLCSLSEGLPTILPEAMLCRTPVVATPVGGVPEIILESETGKLVPCKDVKALTRAIDQILSDDCLASTIATRAEVVARKSLTWTANARETVAVYESAIHHPDMSRTAATCRPDPQHSSMLSGK
jgi:teichuronic acid biosynthesis glycosyltransferase TuaC